MRSKQIQGSGGARTLHQLVYPKRLAVSNAAADMSALDNSSGLICPLSNSGVWNAKAMRDKPHHMRGAIPFHTRYLAAKRLSRWRCANSASKII